MRRTRDYLPPTVVDGLADDLQGRSKAIAAAEWAVTMERAKPCLRMVPKAWHGFCLEEFEALKAKVKVVV